MSDAFGQVAAAVVDRHMPDALVGREELRVLGRPGQVNLSFWESALRGVKDHAGDGGIGAQRHPREHDDPAAVVQAGRFTLRDRDLQRFREDLVIYAAKARLETVR